MLKRKMLYFIWLICFMIAVSSCSSGGGQEPAGQDLGKVPSGSWVIRYYGDEDGKYVEDLNMTVDYWGDPINTIEKDLLELGRTPFLTLDEEGKGTFTDVWGETVDVTFNDGKVTFGDGYETAYVMQDDFLWFQAEYQDYYNVMEKVSEELLAKIKDGAFDCVEPGKAEVGDMVTLGTFDTYPFNEKTEPLRWRVLAKEDNRILILCDELIDVFAYNTNPDQVGLNDVTWENSSLRAFLNGTDGFLQMFTDDEIAKMQVTHLENNAANEELMAYWGEFHDDPSIAEIPNFSNFAVQDLGDDPPTDDRVFLLSFQEVEKYLGKATEEYKGNSGYPFDAMPASSDWIAYITKTVENDAATGFGMYDTNTYAGAWMTRTLCTDHHDEKMVAYITANGQIYQYFSYAPMFIRPAMWVQVD